MMDLIVSSIGNFMLGQYPGLNLVFSILGTLVILASAIDALLPSSIDGDFFQKLSSKPVISNIINFLSRFSVLRNKQ